MHRKALTRIKLHSTFGAVRHSVSTSTALKPDKIWIGNFVIDVVVSCQLSVSNSDVMIPLSSIDFLVMLYPICEFSVLSSSYITCTTCCVFKGVRCLYGNDYFRFVESVSTKQIWLCSNSYIASCFRAYKDTLKYLSHPSLLSFLFSFPISPAGTYGNVRLLGLIWPVMGVLKAHFYFCLNCASQTTDEAYIKYIMPHGHNIRIPGGGMQAKLLTSALSAPLKASISFVTMKEYKTDIS